MSTILLAILALGSEGTATRTIVVEPSIERIVWQVIVGGVSDVARIREGNETSTKQKIEALVSGVKGVSLAIDGQPRTGIIAWLAAAHRVAGYALDLRTGGSVQYEYRLRVRGYDIRRRTTIADGHVLLTTDAYGLIGPSGELYRVRLAIEALERVGGRTTIHGTATGYSHIGDRCRLIRRIAERQITDAMGRELLAVIEQGGRAWYSAGTIAEVLR